MAVRSAFEQEMNSLGHTRVDQLFTRQKALHRVENGKAVADPVCLFKVMEGNYEFPFDKSKHDSVKHKVCEFAVSCSICNNVHNFKVVR